MKKIKWIFAMLAALGVLAGCNVIMPNLSPTSVRKKYLLYDNKAGVGDDAKSGLRRLREQMDTIGYEVEVGRGDYKKRSATGKGEN